MLEYIENWMRVTYEWTWHLSSFGLVAWGIYLFGSVAIGGVVAFSAFYWDTVKENPPIYLNPLMIIFGLVMLFFVVGIVGNYIYIN